MTTSRRRLQTAALLLSAFTTTAAANLSTATNWTVLEDTDFLGGNCPHNPFGPGKSVEDCADQCAARNDCVAVSWNGPNSPIHDLNCNFKCVTIGKRKDVGEQVGYLSGTL